MKTILIIEDDENLNRGIVFSFEKDGYSVFSAASLKEGHEYVNSQNPDLIILDLGLPDGNGMDFCRDVRKKSNVPIIMLTAHDMEIDEVSGLMAGADDYITKPFSLSVLRARVDAILRRIESKDSQYIESGIYILDTNLCKLFCYEKEIAISATEFKLLKFFMLNAGKILSKDQILHALWDNQGNFVDDNTISVNISRLRSKIENDPKNPVVLKTVHGLGYIWENNK